MGWGGVGGSCPLITHERMRDVNADGESGGGDAQQCNSVFLFLSAVVLHSVSCSVIHGLIILTHGAVFLLIKASECVPAVLLNKSIYTVYILKNVFIGFRLCGR